jgi:GT2 family glycosyltransferase
LEERRPLVSIIVRTKDRPQLLKRALQSIAGQTYRPIEVVLVNDGGCDVEIEELEAILGDISLNYERLGKNMGRAHAGNVGIGSAKGKYIGFLDDDDEFYPEHVQTLVTTLIHGPYLVAYTDSETVLMELTKDGDFSEKSSHISYQHEFIPEVFLIQNYIPFMCLLFDRRVFEGIRIDEDFDLFEDWNLLLVLSQKYTFAHIKKITARYIQWSDEAQINRKALTEDFSKEVYKKILGRNSDKITPEILYTYCVVMNSEKARLVSLLTEETYERQKSVAEKEKAEAEKRTLEAEKERILSEKNSLEAERNTLEAERNTLASVKQRLEGEKEMLYREFVGLQNHLAEITGSMSWRIIIRYRKIKEKLAPLGSRRRAFYDLLLKSVRAITQEGIKGFITKVKRRMRFTPGYMKLRYRFIKKQTRDLAPETRTSVELGFCRKPVCIVMPVYNGYECIGDCINSIFRHTDLTFHSLVMIDDKSTDPKVSDYLSALAENNTGRHLKILSNVENLGFVKTINRGMQSATEDVIILNSDTIITDGWVEKLQRAAYSKPRVATATPLSNYVTINGIPNPFKFNPVPLGMDVDSFGAFLERISLRYYPEVPAGVGFCMYIKRSVLGEMGYFDDAKFEKGYAEETDFCMRALKKGYLHVIDDATYIYHIGGVSFESVKDPEVLREKNIMIERNNETLRKLHPEYMGLVEKAVAENLTPVHNYINLRLEMEEKRAENTVCNRSEA